MYSGPKIPLGLAGRSRLWPSDDDDDGKNGYGDYVDNGDGDDIMLVLSRAKSCTSC